MAADTSLPAVPARTVRRPSQDDRSVRSAVAVAVAGAVLVALLVGGGAVVATLVDLASWIGTS